MTCRNVSNVPSLALQHLQFLVPLDLPSMKGSKEKWYTRICAWNNEEKWSWIEDWSHDIQESPWEVLCLSVGWKENHGYARHRLVEINVCVCVREMYARFVRLHKWGESTLCITKEGDDIAFVEVVLHSM